jgi:negative regulator of replication initiation
MLDYENSLRKRLYRDYPFAVLHRVPVFRPDMPELWSKAFEIDFLMHFHSGMEDLLIVIECKDQKLVGSKNGAPPEAYGEWLARYPNANGQTEFKNVKSKQLDNHLRAVASYLTAYNPRNRFRFEGWVIASSAFEPWLVDDRRPKMVFRLLQEDAAFEELKRLAATYQCLRIEQSPTLTTLQHGLPLPSLGHPEIRNAIDYVARCRTNLDLQLFRAFALYKRHTAINGSAGMGKSVLLAYALFVLATNKCVDISTQDPESPIQLVDFDLQANELDLPPLEYRVISVFAQKPKQIEMLQRQWEYFLESFGELNGLAALNFKKPHFAVWEGEVDSDCNILLIDEAHDLPDAHQDLVRQWISDEEIKRCLVIACDRHQKLRLAGPNATLVRGLNFSGHTKKLARNYRNPFPVYSSALGIMFRWFAQNGPKIVPKKSELKDEFSFEVLTFSDVPNTPVMLESWNDSHPANRWSFTVSLFPSCEVAHRQLACYGLRREEILWVRFGEEDPFFNYELLADFTYHNCHGPEALQLLDKYIKGQEFAIVVVEGLPSDFEVPERERWDAMWQARRQVFLCCSRCTAFLYFIPPPPDSFPKSVTKELNNLIGQLSRPKWDNQRNLLIWRLQFTRPHDALPLPIFDTTPAPPPPPLPELRVAGPITILSLAKALGLQPSQLTPQLRSLSLDVSNVYRTLAEEDARDLALKFSHELIVESPATSSSAARPSITPTTAKPQSSDVHPGPVSKASRALTITLTGIEPRLRALIQNPRFLEYRSVTDKYLLIMSEFAVHSETTRKLLLTLSYPRRLYFAEDPERIRETLRGGAYGETAVRRIPNTNLWAFVGTDTQRKRSIVNDLLFAAGVSWEIRTKIGTAMVDKNSWNRAQLKS